MDAIEALKTRRSIRRYEAKPVARETLQEIVDCGRLAATARGEEPWEFVVVTDEAMRRRLAGLCDYGRFIADAPACIVTFCRDTKYYLEDGSAATQNMLVAAHALGLGACWIAGDKKGYAAEIAGLLGVPATHKLVSLMSVGHTSDRPRKEKRPLDEVLHWDKF